MPRLPLLLIVLLSPTLASAENWPSWRGPLGNGVSSETGLPSEFNAEINLAWRLELPGAAGATPAVWGDRIFLTSVQSDNLILMCVGTDGKELWRKTLSTGDKPVRGDEGNSASPSPVTDGKRVWAMMANGVVGCYDFQGNEVWKKNMSEAYGPFDIAFGMTSTPVLHDGKLYFQFIHGDGKAATEEATIVAVEAATGNQVWKSPRITGAYSENEHSYASPVLYPFGAEPYLITHGADYTVAYNLADGSERWRLGGLNPHDDSARKYHTTLRFVASPGIGDGIVIVPTAKDGPVFAIRADLKGDLLQNDSTFYWQIKTDTPDVPTPLIHDGLAYLCRENGNLMCVEATTGKQLYYERTHRARHRASPVYADGKIFLAARDGKITVVKAGREFEILAQNDLKEEISASPVVSGRTLYLRTFNALWAIRAK